MKEGRNQHKNTWQNSLDGGQQVKMSQVRTDPGEALALGGKAVGDGR